jgi:hypothetical protein
MKKIFMITITLLMATVMIAKAGNPIPTFNFVITDKSTFQESPQTLNNGGNIDPYRKRDMTVQNGNAPIPKAPVGPGSLLVTAYVYRLDQSIVLGPFTIPYGQQITVTIDGYPWGVSIVPNSAAIISVWAVDEGVSE